MNKFSIILPSFNSSKTIYRSIQSVCSQSYADWELIVVSDGSTDNSNSIVNSFLEKDSRISLICLEKNMGVSFARNVGLESSTGDYIAFIDSDDEWLPNKLTVQKEYLDLGYSIVYSSYYLKKKLLNSLL